MKTQAGLFRGRCCRWGRWVKLGFNHLIWPAKCLHCSADLTEEAHLLCPACWADLLACSAGTYCEGCGRDVSDYALVEGRCLPCRGQTTWLDGMARCGVYDLRFREMILRFKNGATELRAVLSPMADQALHGCTFFDQIEVLAPVPLHWTRRIRRGYNQSAILARSLHHPRAGFSRGLVRTRATQPQPVAATEARRRRNVQGAFAVRPAHNRLEGRCICLVDDIKTTGATLNECARILKQKGGAAKVYALVLAVAGQKTKDPV